MQKKHLGLIAVVALGVAAGFWWTRHSRDAGRPNQPSSPPPAVARTSSAIMPASTPAAPKPEVAIQDHRTIDFSSGKPVVKDSTEDRAAIDAAVKEMDAAAANITFAPTPPSATAAPAPRPGK